MSDPMQLPETGIEPRSLASQTNGYRPAVSPRFVGLLLAALSGALVAGSLMFFVGRASAGQRGTPQQVPVEAFLPVSPTCDNERAGTSSEPDTVSTDARLASPKAGVVVRGGLDRGTSDDHRELLGADASGWAVSHLDRPDQNRRLRAGLVSGAQVAGPQVGLGAQSEPSTGRVRGLPHLRQPAVRGAAASIRDYARGEHPRPYPQGPERSQCEMGSVEPCVDDLRSDSPGYQSPLPARDYAQGDCPPARPQIGNGDVDSVGETPTARPVAPASVGASPDLRTPPATSVKRGIASWYCGGGSPCTSGYGPSDLIAAIDPTLGIAKGEQLTVTYRGRAVVVRVVDVCACAGSRIIDLSRKAFAALADPSMGLIRVTIASEGPSVTVPPTDVEATVDYGGPSVTPPATDR